MRQAIDDEEAQADDQFWNQEFFQEEAEDIDYLRSDSTEDEPDSDFDEPVGVCHDKSLQWVQTEFSAQEEEEDEDVVDEGDERPKCVLWAY
jgi:hypothetical protein